MLSKSFVVFSEGDGELKIGMSKIQDKASHLNALQRYSSICQDKLLMRSRKYPLENSYDGKKK